MNGRGLDVRLRVPDWVDGLEAALREMLGKSVTRGNVTLNLRVQRDGDDSAFHLNTTQLDNILAVMRQVEDRATAAGVALAQPTAADILAMRGVMDQGVETEETAPLKTALLAEFPALIAAFADMREREGASLRDVLETQLAEIADLTESAAGLLEARREEAAETLQRNLAKVLQTTGDAAEARVAQELALIAVKSDVTEEIDRLRSHVMAARDLLEAGGAVGRKLDFLMQEFNREANTLCSKAQMKALTEQGLALKVVIDQMREQVQNVE